MLFRSVGPFGLMETQIRISTGLEKFEDLLEEFKVALDAADKAKPEEGEKVESS